jgi:hypothetical protein
MKGSVRSSWEKSRYWNPGALQYKGGIPSGRLCE